MGKIIFCSDLVVRVTDSQLLEMAAHAADGLDWGHAYNDGVVPEITNVTEWLMTSTDFRPAYPDGCVVRNEMSTMGKLGVIMAVWSALVILTTFYCYYCEQRLFPKGKLKEKSGGSGMNLNCCTGRIDADALLSGQTAIRSSLAADPLEEEGYVAVAADNRQNNRDMSSSMHKTVSQSSLMSSTPTPKKDFTSPSYHQNSYYSRRPSSTLQSPVGGGGGGRNYHRI